MGQVWDNGLNLTRLKSWRTGRILGDRFVTSSAIRWTWTGLGQTSYHAVLTDFRPTDGETAEEMVRGRYLLASHLVDSQGGSPFGVRGADPAWHFDLQSFSWLRHFRDARDQTSRHLARTLALDWIGRHGSFDAKTWGLRLSAMRVMNWLRHYALLTEGASTQQVEAIDRSINLQVQAAKLRAGLAYDPLDELFARILLLGATLSEDGSNDGSVIATEAQRLCDALDQQLGRDGLHRSRNASVQVDILTELVTLRQALTATGHESSRRLGEIVDRMLFAFSSIVLGTGEPGYFNGSGHLSADILLALQLVGATRRDGNALTGGYGVIEQGRSVVIMDSGRVPDPAYAADAHAGALAFEFSHGNQLIAGNCGPAPSSLREHKDAFRQGVAHSAPTIEGQSAARIGRDGLLYSYGDKPYIEVGEDDANMVARSSGFRSRYGVQVEREISLISDGESLVGRDRMVVPGRRQLDGQLTLSFHLGPGVSADQVDGSDMVRLVLRDGSMWQFLWEGAELRIEESVRQSAHVGFHRTQQVLLTCPLVANGEVAWIFTKQSR